MVENYNEMINDDIRPQDDFFSYVNKKWLDNHPIPENRVSYGIMMETFLENQKKIQGILENDYEDEKFLKFQLSRKSHSNIRQNPDFNRY